MAHEPFPYFDYVLAQLARNDAAMATSFGRHVHWGYWEDPAAAICDTADYARAAEQLTLELCALAQVASGQRILDVGCGFGGTMASLNERLTGLQLTGLNIDLRQLRRAREQVHAREDNQVAIVQGDACALPFADASFDRVLAVECVFHFPSRERFFREAYRVLKPGGLLTLSDFIPSRLFLPAVLAVGSTAWFTKRNYFGHCDVRYTVGRYRRLGAASGLGLCRERNITGHTLPTYRYVKNLLGKETKIGGYSAARLIDFLSLLGRARLLNYGLLAFRKD